MKKFLTFNLLFTISLLGFSQSWAPSGAKWYYSHHSGLSPELTVIESAGDTLIDGKQCRVLKSYMIHAVMLPNWTYQYDTLNCSLQYSYEDAGKVYLYDPALTGFRVLYDFYAAPGSTQTVFDTPFNGFCPDEGLHDLFQYTVDSINDTVIGGMTLKRQYTSPTPNADWLFSNPNSIVGDYPIMEWIGSLKYLFGVSIGQPMEGGIRGLRCYRDSTIFFKASFWPDNLPCDYLRPLYTRVDEMDDFKRNVTVHPNPFCDYIRVDNRSNTDILEYELVNSAGVLVKSEAVNKSPIRISTNDLSAGFYLLKLKTNQFELLYKVIRMN